jgi:hypothetical protein
VSRNYYFLAASLADVSWGAATPRGTLDELIAYLEGELHPQDTTALRQLFLFNDMRNAVSYHVPDDAFVTPSCYDRDTMAEAAESYSDVLPFLNDFFEIVRGAARVYPEIPVIDEMSILFYDRLDDIESSFVRDYYLRELNVRNLTIALSRESRGFPYRERLIPRGDAFDAIMTGTPPDFELSADFPFVEELVRVFKTTDLTAHEETMERLRWNWLDERVGPQFFSTEFILSYVIKYQSVERWQTLNEEKGDELFGELLDAVRRSVRFSLEFSEVGDKQDDGRKSNRDQQ